MSKPVVNVAASIRQRLLNLSRERKEDFGLVLTKYGLERILYRMAQSRHRELFVLKGAILFELWTEQRYRPTRDADFLARGENNPERFIEIFKENRLREERIHNEVIVDAYGPEEQALGWYYYLENKISFPLSAR